MLIIHKIIRKLFKIIFPIYAKFFSFFYLKHKVGKLVSEDLTNKSFLIIAPHADDEYIGCYELIKTKSIQNKIKLFLCSYLGSNNSEKNRIIRTNEFVCSCKHQNVDYLIANYESLKEDLKKCIDDFKPDYILLTSIIDPHYEHRKINYLLADILEKNRRQCKIIWYPVSMPISPEFVNMVQEYSSNEKWKTFRSIYKSQIHMHLERFQTEERILGRLFNSSAVEGFILLSYEEWNNALYNLTDDMVRILDRIKSSGNESHLFRIYRLSKKYYSRILNNNLVSENNNSFMKFHCETTNDMSLRASERGKAIHKFSIFNRRSNN